MLVILRFDSCLWWFILVFKPHNSFSPHVEQLQCPTFSQEEEQHDDVIHLQHFPHLVDPSEVYTVCVFSLCVALSASHTDEHIRGNVGSVFLPEDASTFWSGIEPLILNPSGVLPTVMWLAFIPSTCFHCTDSHLHPISISPEHKNY